MTSRQQKRALHRKAATNVTNSLTKVLPRRLRREMSRAYGNAAARDVSGHPMVDLVKRVVTVISEEQHGKDAPTEARKE